MSNTQMTSKTVPRYLALTATLSLVVGGLMLIVFYGQHRWMSMEMIEAIKSMYRPWSRQPAAGR